MRGKKIILLGFSGGGKTTVGKLLSERTGMPDLDTDAMIVESEGRSIADIFASEGEPYFRDLETGLLERLLNDDVPAVLAIGGGMPVRPVNREYLKRLGRVFYLKARIETLARRLKGDTDRPLLQTDDLEGRIRRMLADRENIYLEMADNIIDTDDMTAEETADRIISLVKH